MCYRVCAFVFVSFVSVLIQAQPALVDLDTFQPGVTWVWSYSERADDEGAWPAPYLFETYKVVERQGDRVTIDMASHDSRRTHWDPHHRFVVNLKDCLNSKKSLRRLFHWKIAFYTKTRSADWHLVSRKHDNLAFIEKFNCYDGPIPFQEILRKTVGEVRVTAKWLSIPLQSFYIADQSQLAGVAAQRRSRNYQMLLDSSNLVEVERLAGLY